MSQSSANGEDMATMLRAFEQSLSGSVPFSEDVACLRDLANEVRPVLEVLLHAYRETDRPQAAMHEGYALFTLLCRRAGQLGATPVASVAVLNAVQSALAVAGLSLSEEDRQQLLMVAVEAYTAGRDDHRELTLRTDWARTQVWVALAPRCFAVFLAGAHPYEQLEPLLERIARELFRADARCAVLDLSRLLAPNEETARLVAGFVSTLLGLGTRVFVHGDDRECLAWIAKLGLERAGVELCADFAQAQQRALDAAGYELRARRRLVDLLGRRRAGG